MFSLASSMIGADAVETLFGAHARLKTFYTQGVFGTSALDADAHASYV